MKKEIKDASYVEKFVTFRNEPFFKIASQYCKQGMKILDVGAGKGGFAQILGEPNVYLLDGNPESIECLKKKYKNVFQHLLPEALPFEDQFFDVIHCSHIIEHLDPSSLYASLKEFDRCLKPKGKLIVSTPLLYPGFYDDLSHVKPYTPWTLRHYLSDPGLDNRTRGTISNKYDVVDIFYRYSIEPIPYINISHSRKWAKNLLIRLVNLLRNLNVGFYQKTAYTLILQKNTE